MFSHNIHFHIGSQVDFLKIEHVLVITTFNLGYEYILNCLNCSVEDTIGKSEAIYQTFTYFGSLAWNYISSKIPTDVSYICFKNIAKLHLQSNNLPQIRLNV